VPSLYLAQGLPYAVVMSLALVLYRDLGVSNAQIAWITGWMYLPWVIKPLWSPLLVLVASERRWTLWMQGAISLSFAIIALLLARPWPDWLIIVIGIMWIIAFASATHDVAADGYYLRALDQDEQARFVGVRSLAFRVAMLSVSGVFVALIGLLFERTEDPFDVWAQAFALLAIGLALLALWHAFALPRCEEGPERASPQSMPFGVMLRKAITQYRVVIADFFSHPDLLPILCFLLLYRFSESQLLRLIVPFLMDGPERGGLALSHAELGFGYGGLGVVALSLGGLLGGYSIARWGLRRMIWPMAWCLNLPNLAYAVLAWHPQLDKFWVYAAITIEQLGYGFGFAAYLVFMLRVAQGRHPTAHYALCTGLMALGMMIPGMPAGWIQSSIGYPGFFIWVLISAIPSMIAVAWIARRRVGFESA